MLTIHPLSRACGAEVSGLDLTAPIAADVVRTLHRALGEHGILLFRAAGLTPEQHIAFSRRFGPLESHVVGEFNLPDHPEIFVVSNVKEEGKLKGAIYAGQYWHSDLSYKEKPSLGSLLHARELPAEGGDTLFANMHLAWETLPAALQRAVDGLQAEHTYLARYAELQQRSPWRPNLTPEQIAQVAPVLQPVVRTHPETGRRALFVSEHFTTRIAGLPEDESRDLLAQLFAHCVKPEHIYRHAWQEHDLVFWDNRSLLHLAAGCPPELRRVMYRTTIEGDVPR